MINFATFIPAEVVKNRAQNTEPLAHQVQASHPDVITIEKDIINTVIDII